MDTPKFGQVTTGDGNVHQLSSLAGAPGSSFSGGIVLKSKSTNTGVIYVGHDANLTANNGFELKPGDGLSVEILNDEKIYVLQTVNGDRLCWGTVTQ